MTHLLDSLGWALLHSLWQGGLAFCLVIAFRNLWKGAAPSARYGFQLLALIGCFAAFLATFAVYMGSGPQSSGAVLNFIAGGGGQAAPTALQTGLTNTAAGLSLPADPAAYTALLGMIWCLGFAFMALRYSAAYIAAQHLRRVGLSAIPPLWENRFRTLVLNSGLNENVRLFISSRVTGPLTVGFIKPLVLVPAGFLTGLPREQVEAILLHELAHIRRYDYLFNLVQTAIKTVFFFHPAIHYISKQIDIDREEACDDLAVAQSRNPQALARGLAALQLSLPTQDFTMAAKGADMPLLSRLKRLAGTAEQQRRPEHLMMSVLTTLLIGGIYLGTSGAANAHPEKADDAYEHAKASKHNYRFETIHLDGKPLTAKITEDGRRWVLVKGAWYDVDKAGNRDFIENKSGLLQYPPQPPQFKSSNKDTLAGGPSPYDIGFDDKMDQFQIDMEYFEASMERYTDGMNGHIDRVVEREVEKAVRAAERAERDAERMADRMEQARDREDQMRDREEEMREREEEQEERAEEQRERAEEQRERAEEQRERAEEQAERQRERAEEAREHASTQHTKYNVIREKLYSQLLRDKLISSRNEKVTLTYTDKHWVANGTQVPKAAEGKYCELMSDLGVKKSTIKQVDITPKSVHVMSESQGGKHRQTHDITYGEFNHSKTKIKTRVKATGKHKHKDGTIHDPSQEAQARPVMPAAPVAPQILPINYEISTPVFVKPTKTSRITAKYGMSGSLWPQTHQGIDLAAKTGAPVFAAADGTVKLLTTEDAWGHRIILEHKDGFQTLYGHLNGFNVKPGQAVKAGDVIAGIGSTGKSTGPHLHFEIRKDGETLDPENLIF